MAYPGFAASLPPPGFGKGSATACAPPPEVSPPSSASAASSHSDPVAPESTLCIVCQSAPKNMAFIPCGHQGCCDACAARVQHCPLCRVGITGRLRLY